MRDWPMWVRWWLDVVVVWVALVVRGAGLR